MSPKELLYIEDALGHEQQVKCTCKEGSTQLTDNELKNFMMDIQAKHQQCFDKFYSLLG